MAIQYIPIQQSEPNYRIGVTLTGVSYLFDVRWNDRDLAWYFDVYDANENLIRGSLKVVIGTFIGRACNLPPFSTGVFIAMDATGKGIDAGFDDFGTRVQLLYFPTADLLTYLNGKGAT